jgi:hypothetical protein
LRTIVSTFAILAIAWIAGHSEATAASFGNADHIRFACSFTKHHGTAVAIDDAGLCESARKALEDLASGHLALDRETLLRRRPSWIDFNNPRSSDACRAGHRTAEDDCNLADYQLEYADVPLPTLVIGIKQAHIGDKNSFTVVVTADAPGLSDPKLLRLSIHIVEPPGSFVDLHDSVETEGPEREASQLRAEFQLEWMRYFSPRDFNALMEHYLRRTP